MWYRQIFIPKLVYLFTHLEDVKFHCWDRKEKLGDTDIDLKTFKKGTIQGREDERSMVPSFMARCHMSTVDKKASKDTEEGHTPCTGVGRSRMWKDGWDGKGGEAKKRT